MKKNKKYTFLEWVFEDIGLKKFFIYYFAFIVVVAVMELAFVWWYTKQ